MFVTVTLSSFALLGFGLLLWQFAAARRFPLHRRVADDSFAPGITILKPLKGLDEHTTTCLQSWLTQNYRGPVQVLFGVADADDPAYFMVRKLLKQFPAVDAELILTPEQLGPNGKVANLAQLSRHARHALLCLADADVRAPADLLASLAAPLRDPGVGLVNCFYRLANPDTPAMRWEAVAVNADFWSQVLQSNTLKPQDFALGAVMLTRQEAIAKIGGFEPLLHCLADDYQLGHRIARAGFRIELSPIVVECWDRPMGFRAVWNHQLRWARTIRVSQPVPYFFSILSNATLWAALLALFGNLGGFPLVPDSFLYSNTLSPRLQNTLSPIHVPWVLAAFVTVLVVRILIAASLQRRLTNQPGALRQWWFVPMKDFLGVALWAAAFLGNTIEWSGRKFRLTTGGRLEPD